MFNSVQNRTRSAGAAIAIDIAPLIDVVFILLIFFLVTATFVRDTGIQVRRPQASASRGASRGPSPVSNQSFCPIA